MKQRSQPPEYTAASSSQSSHPNSYKADRNSYYCDRQLLLSLVHDAKVTEWFAQQIPPNPSTKDPTEQQFKQRFGVVLAFMATHTGLTRWQDILPVDEGTLSENHFSKLYPRAIDEVWYKRAVEQYYIDPDSFVFSVPIDDEDADNTTLVTASRAIFVKKKAPAAVVGFQFQYTALQALLQNITFCDGNCDDNKHCGDIWACYLIDNNGYIIAAGDEIKTAGKFFGDVRGPIMSSLVKDGVFERIRIYDYQAVCFKSLETNNTANILLTPWKHFLKVMSWVMGQAVWVWAKTGILQSDDVEAYSDDDSAIHENYHENEETTSIR